MSIKNIVNSVGIFNDSVAIYRIFSEQLRDEQCFLWIVQGQAMILVK